MNSMANQSDIIDIQMTGDTTGLVQAVKNLENVTKTANVQFKNMSDFLDQINQKASKLKNDLNIAYGYSQSNENQTGMSK